MHSFIGLADCREIRHILLRNKTCTFSLDISTRQKHLKSFIGLVRQGPYCAGIIARVVTVGEGARVPFSNSLVERYIRDYNFLTISILYFFLESQLMTELEDEQNQNKVLKKKHAASLKVSVKMHGCKMRVLHFSWSVIWHLGCGGYIFYADLSNSKTTAYFASWITQKVLFVP